MVYAPPGFSVSPRLLFYLLKVLSAFVLPSFVPPTTNHFFSVLFVFIFVQDNRF